jgi:hypothetical protein
MSFLSCIKFWAAAAVTVASASTFAASALGSNSGIMWGINSHDLGEGDHVNLAQNFQRAASLGVKHYRSDFYDPAKDQYLLLRNMLAAAKPYGIVITPVLVGHLQSNENASYSSGYNLAKGFAQNFPEISVFELSNEINGQIRDPDTDGSLPSDWTTQPAYASVRGFIRGMTDGLKAGNPKARAAFGDAGGCNYGLLQALWKDGVRWDITVFHPYDFWGDLDNRGTTRTHCRGGDNMAQKHADFGKPLWLTEFNYTPAVKKGDKAGQGSGLVRMMTSFNALAKKYDIEAADIYELYDEPGKEGAEAHFGVFTNTGAATAASQAVKNYLSLNPSAVYDLAISVQTPASSESFSSFALNAGGTLAISKLGMFLAMQADGNLVLYQTATGQPLWHSATGGMNCGDCMMTFQGDGNLVLYQRGTPYWTSESYGNSNSVLVINNVAPYVTIKSGNSVVWSGY